MGKQFQFFLFACIFKDRSHHTNVIHVHMCTALVYQYLGRVLLRKDQNLYFRDDGQDPSQVRMLQLTENYLKTL